MAPTPLVSSIDHVVLTVFDVERTCDFYARVLGLEVIAFGEGRKALAFGRQKLNLHQSGREFEPKALKPTPGAIDLCFVTETPIEEIEKRLEEHGVAIALGPVAKTGALGPMLSIYFRDPDGNLVEVANYAQAPHEPT